MAQIHWAGDVGGNFATAADWAGDIVPGAADDAILDAAGATKYNVTVTSTGTIHSLQTAATATLLVKVGSGAGGFEALAGSGAGANAGTITVADGGDFIFGGTLANSGRINVSAAADATELTVAGSATLSGVGQVRLTDSAHNGIVGQGAGATLTNAGNLIQGAGTIGGGGLVLVNARAGHIDANGVNALVLDAGQVTNAGTLEATNAALATTGGLSLVGETIANTGLIFANGAHTHVDLFSTTIVGGTLNAARGGVVNIADGGSVLDGLGAILQVDGAMDVENGMDLTIEGVISLVKEYSGVLSLSGAGAATQLTVAASGARIESGGLVSLTDNASNAIDAAAPGASLVLFAATIAGAGTIGGGGLVLNDDQGVIDATGATNALVINTGANTITNSGIIEATGAGGLIIDSTVRNGATGKIEVSGGATLTVNNASIIGGTLLAGTGSTINLANIVTSGVTLTTTGTGVINASGSLSKDTIGGDLAVTPGTDLYVSGVMAVAGTISMITNFESENGTQLRLRGSTSLEGGGGIYMGGSVYNQNFIDGNANPTVSGKATGYVLTNVDDTISGAGHLGIGGLGLGWLTIVNDAAGVIDGSSAIGQLTLSTGANSTVINAGTLEGSGAAGLQINAAVSNTGTVLAVAGGQVELTNNASITGGQVETTGSGVINIVGGGDFTNVDNTGNVAINDGDVLYIGGSLVNSGTITLDGAGHGASLQLAGKVTLTGAGHIVMGGSTPWSDAVDGDFYAPGGSLVNVNNTISGGGNIGGGNPLPFTNEAAGVIDGSSKYAAMTLDVAGGGSITNLGLIEATSAPGLTVTSSQIVNTGGTVLAATGSQILLNGNANITGGVVKSAGTGVFLANGASFTGVASSATVDINDGYVLTLVGTFANTGVINMAGQGHGGNLDIAGTVTMNGGGHIVMGGTAPWNNSIGGDGTAGELILAAATISGGGTLGNAGGGLVIINDAGSLIDANSTLGALTINVPSYGTLTNLGQMESTGGGALNIVSSVIANTGGTITAAANSFVDLAGNATIVGGVLKSGTGGSFVLQGSATFVGLATSAAISIGDGDALDVSGAINNTGTITLACAGHGGGLDVDASSGTLTGGGHIVMGGTTPWNDTIGVNGGSNGGTWVNVNNTISGGGQINNANGGLAFTNETAGVIDANSTLANLTLTVPSNGTMINQGLIEATGGAGLVLGGTQLINTGGTVDAAAGSTVTLNNNASIIGGTVETGAGGAIDLSGGASFRTLTNKGTVNDLDGDELVLVGPIDNTGTIILNGGGHGGNLLVAGAVTLTGVGVIAIGGNNGPWNDNFGGDGAGSVLTNDSTIKGEGNINVSVINGASGVIEGASDGVADGYALYLRNNGTSVVNQGVIEAVTGGNMQVQAIVNNTGTLEANGGDIVVSGGLSGAGRLVVNGGTLEMNVGAVSESAFFQAGGGTLQLDQSRSFTGHVSGFLATGASTFDLRDIGFNNSGEATFVENGAKTSGVLTVTDGTNTSKITLIGDYSADTFTASSDGSGGTLVVAGPTPGVAASPTVLASAMAAMPPAGSAHTAATLITHIQPLTPLVAHG